MPIGTQTADEIVEKILHLPEGTKVYVMAPVEAPRRRALRGALGRASRLGVHPGPGRRPVGQPRQAAQAEPPPQAPDRGGDRPRDRPPRHPLAPGRLGRVGARPGQGGRPRCPGRRRRTTSRNGTSTVTASIARATAAAGASRSCRRTTSRSTARSAGARSARAWARSMGPTRRCWSPTAAEPPRRRGRRLAGLRREPRLSPG